MPEITGRLRDAFQATADIVQPGEVAPFSVRDAASGILPRRERSGAAGPGPSARDGLPPFFVTWAADGPNGTAFAVGDAATGAPLGQVYPPQPGTISWPWPGWVRPGRS
jgi:hypothetical protein